ncbi:MAG: hypothetical protein K8S00_02135, partial [Bacteroidales bacterium]|nr:hypothetical protein [Bacteroidales bacterium]
FFDRNVQLIISIDKGDNNEVINIAEKYKWTNGDKKVIIHEQKLGLKDHVFFCGNLSKEHDGVIILEDDLYVSPFFYDFAVKSINYYKSDSNIGGISLYTHSFNETAFLPFIPLNDSSDVYFIQLPSSWGQCWTKNQWSNFKNWHLKESELNKDGMFPPNIEQWSSSSWKKHFAKYLINNDKYFVYPRFSLTTNFGEKGTHVKEKVEIFQVPLLNKKKEFTFIDFKDSIAVYDAFCELIPRHMNVLFSKLSAYDYEIDLYGMKPLHKISKEYLLSTKESKSPIFSFGRDFKPIEYNIIEENAGDKIFFGLTSSFQDKKSRYTKDQLLYYYKLTDYHIYALYDEYEFNSIIVGMPIKEIIKLYWMVLKRKCNVTKSNK